MSRLWLVEINVEPLNFDTQWNSPELIKQCISAPDYTIRLDHEFHIPNGIVYIGRVATADIHGWTKDRLNRLTKLIKPWPRAEDDTRISIRADEVVKGQFGAEAYVGDKGSERRKSSSHRGG